VTLIGDLYYCIRALGQLLGGASLPTDRHRQDDYKRRLARFEILTAEVSTRAGRPL
jgi:hypothetical protein